MNLIRENKTNNTFSSNQFQLIDSPWETLNWNALRRHLGFVCRRGRITHDRSLVHYACKGVQSITAHPLKQFSAIKLPDGKSNQELEKFCWMHRHQHVFSHQSQHKKKNKTNKTTLKTKKKQNNKNDVFRLFWDQSSAYRNDAMHVLSEKSI